MRTVVAAVGLVVLLGSAVPILAGWRNPRSRFLVGFVQTRDARAADPKRTAAAACWLIFGFAAAAAGLLDPRGPLGYAGAAGFLACLAVAAYVRIGDAPPWLRPAAMRDDAG
jgi:hypothetical protein